MYLFGQFKRYGGHAATLLVYFIFRGARAEDRTRGCLTAARRATCGLRRHPVGMIALLMAMGLVVLGKHQNEFFLNTFPADDR